MSEQGGWPDETRTHARDGGTTYRSRKIRIDIVEGPNAGTSLEALGPDARIGSARSCDVVLADPTVSRHHLTLRVDSKGIRIIDAGSHNGTIIDGLRVLDAYARPDSLLTIGATTLRLRLSNDSVDVPLSSRERLGGMIGSSIAMRRVFAILERVAATDATVLLEAETGTGKELAAEAIHEESPRASGPFVVFDCSAVSPTLMESELFGHVRGAFTGAVADRIGAFEAADGGTLFLDEIGELPLDLQPKLLRVLERLEVRRVGSNEAKRVDVRIVAATNRPLSAEVDAGRFREDLYYRLAVVCVGLPPLRERRDDIPALVDLFAAQLAPRGQPPARLPEATVRTFLDQAWPGNLRELRNAVARALSLGVPDGVADQPAAAAQAGGGVDLSVPLKLARDRMIDAFEEAYLVEALKQTGGNVSKAAEIAGVNRKFIQRAMKRYGLREPDDE